MVRVSEEIDWLRKDEDRKRIFDLIATGPTTASEIRKRVGVSDWWIIGVHLEDLAKHDLIVREEESYKLTEAGREVRGTLSRLEELKKA